jgi:hypothetical protein
LPDDPDIESFWEDRVRLPAEVPSTKGNPSGFVILRILARVRDDNAQLIGSSRARGPAELILEFLESRIKEDEGRCPDYNRTRQHFLELGQADEVRVLDNIAQGYSYPSTVTGEDIRSVIRGLYLHRSIDGLGVDMIIYNFIEDYYGSQHRYPDISFIMGYLLGEEVSRSVRNSQLRDRLRELIVMAGGRLDPPTQASLPMAPPAEYLDGWATADEIEGVDREPPDDGRQLVSPRDFAQVTWNPDHLALPGHISANERRIHLRRCALLLDALIQSSHELGDPLDPQAVTILNLDLERRSRGDRVLQPNWQQGLVSEFRVEFLPHDAPPVEGRPAELYPLQPYAYGPMDSLTDQVALAPEPDPEELRRLLNHDDYTNLLE